MSERPPRRPPRKITEKYLERAAIHYLKRYTAPSKHLRRVLGRRIYKSVRFHGGEVSDHDEALDNVIERLIEARMLDDRRWTYARVEELHRRGASRRAIAYKLRAKGAPADELDAALAQLPDNSELVAARAYAKRRRFGPWSRSDEERKEKREKQLAALARQGFSFGVARAALDDDPESD
jgi:regulatory protein